MPTSSRGGGADDPRRDGKQAVTLPLLPLRDIIVFPHMVVPLFVGREKSIAALEEAMAGDKAILLARAEARPRPTSPRPRTSSRSAPSARIIQLLRLPDGTVKVLVEGKRRARRRRASSTATSSSWSRSRSIAEPVERDRRARGADALGALDLRGLRQAQQADPARDADERRRPSTTRRGSPTPSWRTCSLKLNDKQAILETESPAEAARAALRADAGRDRDPAGREEDPHPRQEADGEDAEGVLPQRADAGDPEGAGRARRVQERDPGARGEDQGQEDVEGGHRSRRARSSRSSR